MSLCAPPASGTQLEFPDAQGGNATIDSGIEREVESEVERPFADHWSRSRDLQPTRKEHTMKKFFAVVMSAAMLAAFSPLAEAQTSCPAEVAQAKEILSKKGTTARSQDVQAPRSLAGARQDGQAPRSQDVQAPRSQEIQAPRRLAGAAPRSQAPASQSKQAPPRRSRAAARRKVETTARR